MTNTQVNELMKWKFQAGENFGFFIPDDREYYWGDFFVNKHNFWDAKNGDRVEARELKKYKWKKPEAKIINVLWKNVVKKPKYVEWIYSWWDGNFGFIDVEGMEKWYFVYGKKKNGARDWDKVKAEIVDFKGKKEAIVVDILGSDEELLIWKFSDKDSFWFVVPEKNADKKWTTWDVFIAGSRKNGAHDWDKVEVKIIKRHWKNPEGIITRILN